MLLIPAIDLKDGACVRLRQGRMAESTVFSTDPVAMAAHWKEQGGRRLHIVDLDGAFAGEPKNAALIGAMVAAMGDVPVQVGGGIRSVEIIDAYLDVGVSAVIVGTKAIEDPEFLAATAHKYPGQVILGLDARGGVAATQGWDKDSGVQALDLARQAGQLPIAGIVYTDIDRDGMMEGLNVAATLEIAQAANLPVIASGGVTNMRDLQVLKEAFAAQPELLLGAITGRAIYEGTLDVAQGQAFLDQKS
ncbi:MAG: 1-(5-phosphoribosyl)-5-[(5-phosphoribosylamino)methylideneamino]imidazole-4-carboxamide isomerase [Gammaproteobacteria bacterium]|nr:1-(5-phosphoribosyl)-5-[(5-phosphoribosylamino)methylideneamino]imidazole-4-carboxamide isomerase [Gammaproteobacteria bacterium]